MKIRAIDFEVWLEAAKPGDRFTYHIGCNAKSGRLNDAVRMAYNSGLVTLTQRRLTRGEGQQNEGSQWEYLATRLTGCRKPASPLPIGDK